MSQDGLPSQIANRYELQDVLGRGGMGIVFKAYDRLTGIPVALPQRKVRQVSTRLTPPESIEQPYYKEVPPNKPVYFMRDKLFLESTAQTPEPGTVYLGLYYIVFPSVTVGFSKFFSSAFGMSLFSIDDYVYFYINPKVSLYQTENSGVAIAYYYAGTFEATRDNFSAIQALGTFGSDKFHATFGFGLGLGDNSANNEGIITLGMDIRLSESAHLISENVFTL